MSLQNMNADYNHRNNLFKFVLGFLVNIYGEHNDGVNDYTTSC